jgi:molybdenum cofactor synthesis domain-containing protein
MEALAGVNAGLLTIYDLSKISEPSLTISDVRLVVKIGGKSGVWFNPQVANIPQWVEKYIPVATKLIGVNFATITLSDRASQGVYEDKSGKLLQQLLSDSGAKSVGYALLADEASLLREKIKQLLNDADRPQLIITSGGTGIGARDIVPETLSSLGGREIPGIGELLRLYGSKFTPFSWGSRSLAVVIDRVVIIALPGSSNAVREGIESLAPILGHLVKMAQGGNHD